MTDTPCMELDDNGLEILERDECYELLRSRSIARVGLSMDALPVVLPVNFVVCDGQVVIRTNEGSKLDAALAHAVIAVEVDDYDPMSHTGWSVLVRGTSRVITDPAERTRAQELWLRPWANEGADRWIAVAIDLVSGRRIRPEYEPHPENRPVHARWG